MSKHTYGHTCTHNECESREAKMVEVRRRKGGGERRKKIHKGRSEGETMEWMNNSKWGELKKKGERWRVIQEKKEQRSVGGLEHNERSTHDERIVLEPRDKNPMWHIQERCIHINYTAYTQCTYSTEPSAGVWASWLFGRLRIEHCSGPLEEKQS